MKLIITIIIVSLLIYKGYPALKLHKAKATTYKSIVKKSAKPYLQIKKEINAFRDSLGKEYKHETENKKQHILNAGNHFTNIIDSLLVPFWLGTAWDFNGVTQIPGTGNIACGYFVTTTLEHAGVKLNRVKLAQAASEQMIKALVQTQHIVYLSTNTTSFTKFISTVKSYGKGIYLIGLDLHTGILLHDGKELYFVHSYFYKNIGVIKEVASESGVLQNSAYKVVGKLTNDEAFLKMWLK